MKGIQQRQHSKTGLTSQLQDDDDRQGFQQQQNESNIEQQLAAALIEKLRLEEMLEFMKDESDKNIEEIAVQKKRADDIEQTLKEAQIEMNISQSQVQTFHTQTKRMEDQLRASNFNFVSVQKKLAGFEKDNKDLQDKLATSDLEKKKISLKWAAASQRGRDEDKLKLRLRELESELGERKLECEDYKKKYVQVNTELRVYKEGELSYKDVVESRFKEVRERYVEEQRQKEELLKQNSLLVQQLEEFSSQFGDQINFNPGRTQQQQKDFDGKDEDEMEENEFVNLERTQLSKEQTSQKGLLIRGTDTKKRQTERKANNSSSKGKSRNNLRNIEEQREQELFEMQSQLEEQKNLIRTLESDLEFKKSEFEGEISKLQQEKEELSEALCVLAQQSPVCSSDKSSEFSDFKQLSSTFLLIKDEQIRKVIEIKVREHLEIILQQAHQQQLKLQQQQQQHIQSTCVCRECGKRVSDKSIEKQLSELQILYDRLLGKHSALLNQQNKQTNMNSLTLIKKSQNASVSEEEKAQEEKAQPLADQAYFYSQGRNEEINGSLRISKAVTGENTIVDSIFREEDEGKAGEINDSKFERSGNNSALIQTILRHGFTAKDQLTEGSQKMLSSLLGKLADTQNLSGHFTSSRKYLNPQNNSFKMQDYNNIANNNNNHTSKTSRSGLPLHTLERSLLRRNKSKENHPIPNGQQQQQHHFYSSSSSHSFSGKSNGNNIGNHSAHGNTSYTEIYASQQAGHLKNSYYSAQSKQQHSNYPKEEHGSYLNNQSSGKLLNRSVDGINSFSHHQAHSSKPKGVSFYQDNQQNNKTNVSAQYGNQSNFSHQDYQDYYSNNDIDICNSNKNMPSFGGYSNYLFQAENQDHSKEEFTSADQQEEFEQ